MKERQRQEDSFVRIHERRIVIQYNIPVTWTILSEPDRNMITLSHLTMRLAGGGHEVTILDDVTLEIPDKQRVAIVGPSGSGKSTLLGLIAGLDRPTSGSTTLTGVAISAMRESALARYRRDHIGYIFQSFHLIPTLTALENVLVPLELAG